MNIQIRANGTKISDDLRDYIDIRIGRLDRLVDHVVDAQLELKKEKSRTGGQHTRAQITLQTGKHVLRAEVIDNEEARAIDQVIDKLERQIRKFNDKRNDRKGRTGVSNLSVQIAAPADSVLMEDEVDDEARLVRTKRFAMKPMDVDEAIDQLELVGHDFFLFHNVDERQLNVIYRRRDGSYGLLGPDRA